jgi:hypothetical protein
MDITRQLYDAENVLRDFIDQVLRNKHGDEWMYDISPVDDMADKWELKRIKDSVSHNAIKGHEKLIQYATVEDLRTIINTLWSPEFQQVFDDAQTVDTYLKILDDYRDANSRRRELFVHQKHLLLGISGDIRSRIALFRSREEAGGSYPRIESARDNLGNIWVPGDPRRVKTQNKLRVGDRLEFIITAVDPEDGELAYRTQHSRWEPNNIILLDVDRSLVEKQALIHLMVKSDRKHHAFKMGYDDRVTMEYEILP